MSNIQKYLDDIRPDCKVINLQEWERNKLLQQILLRGKNFGEDCETVKTYDGKEVNVGDYKPVA